MKCLVLGGAGFIGSHIVDILVEQHHDVRLLDRSPRQWWKPPPAVECIWKAWEDDAILAEALSGTEIVFHLIDSLRPGSSEHEMVRNFEEDLVQTIQMLRLCVRAKVRRVVFASSGGAIYGNAEYLPIDEKHQTLPINAYGIGKLCIENYLRLFHRLYGLEFSIIRGGNPFGERQDKRGIQGIVAVALGKIAGSLPIELWGSDETVRDFIYVRDLATAFVSAGLGAGNGEVFNVARGEGISLKELFRLIESTVGHPLSIVRHPGRACDVSANVLNCAKARQVLGWQPVTSIAEGLSKSWRWILEHSE